MIDYATKDAIRAWDSEVNAEMRRLIESGTPPFAAITKAQRIVSERRARNAEPSSLADVLPDVGASR